MYRCFHCGEETAIWTGDLDYKDDDGKPGIIQEYHCENCGAEIMYLIPLETDDEEESHDE